LGSEGDLWGLLPGDPRWGGLVEGLGEDSCPVHNTRIWGPVHKYTKRCS